MSTIDVEAMRGRLRGERDELEALSRASSEARATVSLDQQSVGRLSRIDAMQGQAMAQAAERRRAARLSRIAAALQRIDEGEFGVCVACGEDIPAGRLDVDPTVATCVRCADG